MKKLSTMLAIFVVSAGVLAGCSGDSDSLARADRETQARWGLVFSETEDETNASAESETEQGNEIVEAAEGVKMLTVNEMEIQAISAVNVRSGPGTDFEKKAALTGEQVVVLTGICENGWVQIRLNEEIGYVSAQYVKAMNTDQNLEDIIKVAEETLAANGSTEESSAESSQTESSQAESSQAESSQAESSQTESSQTESSPSEESLAWAVIDVNVRKGPGPSYDALGILKQGEAVEVLDSSDTWWWKVSYQGQEAYISVQYLTTNKPE